MRYSVLGLLALLFVGCSSSYDALQVENEKVLDYGMANSKKIEIVNSQTSKTYIIVTYLTPINHELVIKDTEKFIVGSYTATGEHELEKMTLSNFKVNGKKEEIKVSPLDKNAEILKIVSSSNPWADYILVESPLVSDINMTISFENDHSVMVSAKFRKDY